MNTQGEGQIETCLSTHVGVQLADGFSELRLCWGTVKVSVENTGLKDSVPEFRKLQVHPGRKS